MKIKLRNRIFAAVLALAMIFTGMPGDWQNMSRADGGTHGTISGTQSMASNGEFSLSYTVGSKYESVNRVSFYLGSGANFPCAHDFSVYIHESDDSDGYHTVRCSICGEAKDADEQCEDTTGDGFCDKCAEEMPSPLSPVGAVGSPELLAPVGAVVSPAEKSAEEPDKKNDDASSAETDNDTESASEEQLEEVPAVEVPYEEGVQENAPEEAPDTEGALPDAVPTASIDGLTIERNVLSVVGAGATVTSDDVSYEVWINGVLKGSGTEHFTNNELARIDVDVNTGTVYSPGTAMTVAVKITGTTSGDKAMVGNGDADLISVMYDESSADAGAYTVSISGATTRYLDLNMNESTTVVASCSDSVARPIKFVSSDPSVTVNPTTGVVTPNAVGTATITAYTDSPTGKHADVTVKVYKLEYDTNVTYIPGTNVYEPAVTATNITTIGSPVYSNNSGVGTGRIDINLDGVGTVQRNFAIKPFDISTLSAPPCVATVVNGAVSGITVQSGGTTLNNGTDYDVAAPIKIAQSSTEITYKVKVTGKGNYTGNLDLIATEAPSSGATIDMSDWEFDIDNALSITYDGRAITYEADGTGDIKDADIDFYDENGTAVSLSTLVASGAIVVSYDNNVDAGEATMKLTGESSKGYRGVLTDTFTIEPRSLTTGIDVAGDPITKAYTGEPITFDVSLSFINSKGTSISVPASAFTYRSWQNNVQPGTGTLLVRATDDSNFDGNKYIYFTIAGGIESADVQLAGVAADRYSTVYSGKAQTPVVKVMLGGNTLSKRDYKVEYSNNVNAGQAIVTLTAIDPSGFITGSKVVNFEIEPMELPAGLEVAAATRTYTGSPITLNASDLTYVTGNRNIGTLVSGTDYVIKSSGYQNNTDVGTATVTVEGKGNFTGTMTAEYEISPYDLSAAGPELQVDVEDVIFTGSVVKPPVKVTYNGKVMSTDNYDISVDGDGKSIGTHVVTITGKKNLTGTTTESFEIKNRSLDEVTFYLGTGSGAATHDSSKDTADYYYFVSDYEATYDGSSQNPIVKAIDDGTSYTGSSTAIYTAIYPVSGTTDAGSTAAYVTVQGAGKYKGSKAARIYFSIKAKDIGADDVTKGVPTGYEKRADGKYYPKISIRWNGNANVSKRALKEGTDYDIQVTSTTPGVGLEYTVVGKGNYSGSYSGTFNAGKQITSAQLLSPTGTAYVKKADGSYEITYMGQNPKVTVKASASTVDASNYTVTYSGDVNASPEQKMVTIEGKNEYYGTIYVYYTIKKVDISTAEVDIYDGVGKKSTSLTYTAGPTNFMTGTTVKYVPTGMSAIDLVRGADYEASGETIGADSGTYTVTLTGAGPNYEGTKDINVTVSKGNIASAAFTYTDTGHGTYSYTGSAIEPTFTLKDGARILAPGVDYTYVYDNNIDIKDAGAASGAPVIKITGIGNYEGSSKDVNFTIKKRDLSGATLTLSDYNFVYTGSDIEPGVTVMYNSVPLSSSEYTVTYTNNVNPGTATVTVTASSATFSGSLTETFKIKLSIANTSKVTITGVPSDGEKINVKLNSTKSGFEIDNPALTFDVEREAEGGSKATLIKGTDYTVNYGNISPGDARIVVTGIGDYTGTVTYDVKYVGDLSEADITGLAEYYEYTGAPVVPSGIIVKLGNKSLISGIDYNISTSGNTSASFKGANLTVTNASEYYRNSKAENYSIYYNLASARIQGPSGETTVPAQAFDGNPKTPLDTYGVYVAGTALTSGSNYDITYNRNTDVGTASYTITAKTPAASTLTVGSKGGTFVIAGQSIDGAVITYNENGLGTLSKTYTGRKIEPEITVKHNGITLRQGTDYLVGYTDNKNAGTATVTVTGRGNYAGTVTAAFTIDKVNISSDPNVSISVGSMGYANGAPVTPNVSVLHSGESLVEGEDFTYTAGNNTDTGTGVDGSISAGPYVTITGIGNFTGVKTKGFEIKPTDISSGLVKISENSVVYDGKKHNPTVKILVPTKPNPASDADYTEVAVSNYTVDTGGVTDIVDVATYNMKVTGNAPNFTGTLNTTFAVTPKDLANSDGTAYNTNIEVDELSGQDYTGAAVTFADDKIVVWDVVNDVKTKLVKDRDYTFSYENNTKAAAATDENAPAVVIRGKGNYQGTIKKTFSIGEELNDTNYKLQFTGPQSFSYNGAAHKPTTAYVVKKSDGSRVSTANYTIEWPIDQISAGTKIVKAVGKNNYYGTLEAEYQIAQANWTDAMVEAKLSIPQDENGTYITAYTGKEIKPTTTVRIKNDSINLNQLLTEGVDYTVEYDDNTGISTALTHAAVRIIIGGDVNGVTSNYAGPSTVTVPFDIDPIKMSAANVRIAMKPNPEANYNGGAEVLPDYYEVIYTNVDGVETVLDRDFDYQLEFTNAKDEEVSSALNNFNAGKITMHVVGVPGGNFVGEVTADYNIYADLGDTSDTPAITVEDQPYIGDIVKPVIPVVSGGNTLELPDVSGDGATFSNEGFTVIYSSTDEYETVGRITVNSNDTTYYRGSLLVDFNIVKDLSNILCKLDPDKYEYTGQGVELEYYYYYKNDPSKKHIVFDDNATTIEYDKLGADGGVLKALGDKAPKEVGKYRAHIYLKPYTGVPAKEFTFTFEITANPISKDMIKVSHGDGINTLYADGVHKAMPIVTITTDEGTVLRSGTDYDVTYGCGSHDNKTPYVGCVNVKFKGTYVADDTDGIDTDSDGVKDTLHYTFDLEPYPVSNFAVGDVSDTSVTLTWDRNTFPTGYYIYVYENDRYKGHTPSIASTNNSYTVSSLPTGGTLTPGATYRFVILSYVNVGGTEYLRKYAKSVTAVTRPSDLTLYATAGNAGEVNLSWTWSTNKPSSVKVLKSTDGVSNWELVALVPAQYSKLTQKGLNRGQTYYFRAIPYVVTGEEQITEGNSSRTVKVTIK